VWAACVLFFQAVLLAGYFYAHWVRRVWIHVALLAVSLVFLPAAPSSVWKPAGGGDPSLRILLLLTATVGVPYFLLSATAPLLQRWFSLSQPGKSPWRLYALSNLGSFLALLSYPFTIEPFVRLRAQSWIWSGLYAVFVGMCAGTAWRMRSVAQIPDEDSAASDGSQPGTWRILLWLGLSASGSTLLLATTNQISQEIAVSPFLWIAPLSLYLLSFVLTFESTRWYRRGPFSVMAGLGAAAICAVASAAVAVSLWTQLAVYLTGLFAACMVCHGELVRSRPSLRYLTEFYYIVAAGGVLGGVFVALIAPRIFTQFTEYPIGLAGACLLGFAAWLGDGGLKTWTNLNFALRVPLMALLLGGVTSIADAVIIGDVPGVASRRNFYGTLRVSEQDGGTGPIRVLTHGRTIHGFQFLEEPRRGCATSYYGPHSGDALALNALPGSRRIAVIGLGAGTLAAWGRPGDTIRFYEINPDVKALAQSYFFYLKDSRAKTEIVLGDARVQLERELAGGQSQNFDAIAVDAFSSDNIPLHLLTAECGDIYRRHLAPGGLLLLHISNRTLDLEPVARGLAQHLGWNAVPFVSADNDLTGESAATWVLMTANSAFLKQAGIGNEASGWTSPQRPPLLWTDDFASLWHVLRFR
jgi:hypothetical protein